MPDVFTLRLSLHGFGPNSNELADLYIGSQHYTFPIPAYTESVELLIENPDQDSVIRIVPPHPTAPHSADSRLLGIGFNSMNISPIPNP